MIRGYQISPGCAWLETQYPNGGDRGNQHKKRQATHGEVCQSLSPGRGGELQRFLMGTSALFVYPQGAGLEKQYPHGGERGNQQQNK